MWSMVELREIRVFLILAEELHFGHSAERLHLSPSRVSQIVSGLEAKLGVPLFERTSRRVRLTVGGKELREELRPGFDALTKALERAQAIDGAISGTLRIGELCNAGGPRFAELVKRFEARHPGCTVRVYEATWTDTLGPLLRGEIDLLAAWLPIDRPNVVIGPLLKSEPRVLAVAPDHPLAGRQSVTLDDIADHRVARLDALPRELIAMLVPFETPSGRQIRRTSEEMHTLTEIGAQVALGRIVHPTVPSFAQAVGRGPELTYVPITGLPPSRTGLVWRDGNNDPRIHELARMTRDALDDAPPSPDHVRAASAPRTPPDATPLGSGLVTGRRAAR